MRYLPLAARILLGLIFFVFGFIGLLNLMPAQPDMPAKAAAMAGAFAQSGYMFPLIKVTEIVGGALLLSGFAVPFALVLLAPIVVNILFFHLFLTPGQGLGMSLTLLILLLYLAYENRAVYFPLFKKKK